MAGKLAPGRYDFIWAAFQPFGRNMWSDVPVKRWGSIPGDDPERLLEVCAADHVRFDEETARHQEQYGMAIVRQGELWWHDFLYIEGIVEKLGARPWIWSDRCWFHKEEFLRRSAYLKNS